MTRIELDRINVLLALMLVGACAFCAFVFPLLTVSALWLLPVFTLNNALWAMIHEAIHGGLHSSERVNEGVGRLVAIAYGCPLTAARIPHLIHHGLNRTEHDTAELYDQTNTSRTGAAWRFFSIIFGGLYLRELVFPIFSWLPRRSLRAAVAGYPKGSTAWVSGRQLLKRKGVLTDIRLDALLAWLWIATSVWLYGSRCWIVLGFYGWRAINISFTDYVYHYGTRQGDLTYARNLQLPNWASRWMLHFNYHGIHHRFPKLAWTELPKAFAARGLTHEMSYVRSAMRQLHGPMTKEEHLQWSRSE